MVHLNFFQLPVFAANKINSKYAQIHMSMAQYDFLREKKVENSVNILLFSLMKQKVLCPQFFLCSILKDNILNSISSEVNDFLDFRFFAFHHI